jgi:gamma-glutamyltranspeptidase/glutathione hydrolase
MKTITFNRILIWCVLIFASLISNAAERPGEAGIASAHPLATAAGHEVLAAGGNAFDAAVAISAALGVVEPFASGLGGGAFWLLHLADQRTDVFIDARETAPGAATPDMFLDDKGEPIRDASFDGPLSSGIPGQAAGLVHLAEKYGRLPLATSLAPAIRYAEEGIPVYSRLMAGLRFRRRVAERWPAFGDVFYPGGESLQEGDLLRRPDLAKTLKRFAKDGHDGFYTGETARLLVDGNRDAGGIWALQDFLDYQIVEREPIGFFHGRVRILSAPPPSSGGIAIANMLNILKGYDLTELDGVTRKHLVIEAMRRAYRDRTEFLGDTDFTTVPIKRLLDSNYAAGQRASIRADRATPSDSLAEAAPISGKGTNTTHFSVLDKDGNRVAGSMSINSWYGAAFMAPGTGVILNNEMDDFAIKPGVANSFGLSGYAANAIEPGKRMLSSMSPTFLEGERGIAILGTPGGSRIISMVLLAAMAWIDGASAQEMVDLKRYHHQYLPDEVAYEEGALTDEEKTALESLGHTLKTSRRAYGNMNVVTWDFETGKVEAVSDPRGYGEGRVY